MDFRRGSLDSGLSGSSDETSVTRLPPLDPVHQMLERVLHKTLSRKQREAIRPWEAASDGAGHQHSLLSLRPLAQSQPVLTSCGKEAVPGTRCTLRRVAITNSMSDHLEETWGPSGLRAPGLKYLEQVCRLLDRIADLQERNALLKEDKLQLDMKLRQIAKQQELLQHYCSCGSAARSLGDHSLRGFKDSPHLTHKSTTPSQRQPQHLLEHSRRYSHISFQKRWASDPDKVHEANVGSRFQMDERDSRQYRSQDHLASTVHRETFHNNTAQAGKGAQNSDNIPTGTKTGNTEQSQQI
ncbi:uncharacterized protein [Scyliorhinus torazame]|uniref:uncharacterized protein isoform X2 n=1 Tax=Scyliorhinus torazame TaxID=75743 RepID=UPI003B5B57AB